MLKLTIDDATSVARILFSERIRIVYIFTFYLS